ncbi:hypothetical protein V5799_003191 [Amblyomma americanum]|uniref:Nose resistant-to-fluoxetine protein N-terminal domain-containing protein n=1 Tax=Amblyomma americanum TaxID=6943 RepID=A0AAQ4D9N6_AMBAM
MACGQSLRVEPQRTKVFFILLASLLAGPNLCHCSPSEASVTTETAATTTATTVAAASAEPEVSYIDMLKDWIGKAIDDSSPAFTRKLLTAEVSTECSFGLLKLVRGVRNLEPWALRLFDASGKYPTGMFQATRADLGAFDECLETTVRDSDGEVSARGQYCSLLAFAKNNSDAENYILPAIEMTHPRLKKFKNHFYDSRFPTFRLGICTISYCNEQELQELINAVIPPVVDLRVTSCITNDFPRPTTGQIIIIAFLATLAFLVILGTGLDVYTEKKAPKCRHSVLVRLALCFSLLANTRSMLSISKDQSTDAHRFQFLHGLRFLSIVWIVIGHCYGTPSEIFSRFTNNVALGARWDIMVISAGFISVDTFFFLSAFLLTCVVSKQKSSGIVVFLFAVIRRLIRTAVPLFFMLMCMYLIPLITSGPQAPDYVRKLSDEVDNHWWQLLAQVRNYFYDDSAVPLLPHLWYLSIDFQFFLVALPILLVCKKRPRLAIWLFSLLCLLGCVLSAWQVASNNITPFMVVMVESFKVFFNTTYGYYFYPFYHTMCYFIGCITFLSLGWFQRQKISVAFQAAGWCVAIASGLCCIFVKMVWYQDGEPIAHFANVSAAFFDRILWSIFLVWVTLACATGRGGFIGKFLAWDAFVPLSRLTFGVYLIHLPFLQLFLHISRERIFFFHFILISLVFIVLVWSFVLSYILFIFCEAPTAKLDKLAFERRGNSKPRPPADSSPNVPANGFSPEKPAGITCVTDNVGEVEAQTRPNEASSRIGIFRGNGHSGSYQL